MTVGASEKRNMDIHPNPTFGTITVSGTTQELRNIEVMDRIGQSVTKHITEHDRTDSRVIMDLSNLRPGMYYIKTQGSIQKVQKH